MYIWMSELSSATQQIGITNVFPYVSIFLILRLAFNEFINHLEFETREYLIRSKIMIEIE